MANLIKTEGGAVTPFQMSGFALGATEIGLVKSKIKNAKAATADAFTNITPEYWEAKRGDKKTLVFLGWKIAKEKDAAGNVVGESPKAVLHDGDKQIVMGQLTAIEALATANPGETFVVECTDATAGKAKRFTFNRFDD